MAVPRRERVQPYNTADTDTQYIKSVKVDALPLMGAWILKFI